MKNKSSKIAFFAFTSQIVRVLSGPLSLVVLSSNFSSEQLSFYYTFFSLIAMQQLLEMGIGFTIKQAIAHAYSAISHTTVKNYNRNIQNYFTFSLLWFVGIALFIILIGLLGVIFFSDYVGNIEWYKPWICLIAATSIFILFNPLQLLLEGCQYQIELNKAKIFSSIASITSLIFSIISGLELYSIAVSAIFGNLTMYICLYVPLKKLYIELDGFVNLMLPVKDVFDDLKNMLAKISFVWILGYFFWNSFNLIAFKFVDLVTAGKLALTLAIVRSCFNVSESLVSSQVTLYSNYIAINEEWKSRKIFYKSLTMVVTLFLLAFILIFSIKKIAPDFQIFDKVLDDYNVFLIFTYFLVINIINCLANYCRCFKKEPFFYLSTAMNIIIPLLFFLQVFYWNNISFLLLNITILFFLIWSFRIFNQTTVSK